MKLPLKVERVLCIRTGILIIFYTPAHCWQFCCIDRSGLMHKSCNIFYTRERAEIEARLCLDRIDRY